jgi:hypothetical protein
MLRRNFNDLISEPNTSADTMAFARSITIHSARLAAFFKEYDAFVIQEQESVIAGRGSGDGYSRESHSLSQ